MSGRKPSQPSRDHPMSARAVRINMTPSMSTRERTAVRQSAAKVPTPKYVAPVSAPVSSRQKLVEEVASQVTNTLGMGTGSKKAKGVQAKLTEVIPHSAETMPMSKLAAVLDRLSGPPPKVVTVALPMGTLASAASQVASDAISMESVLANVNQSVRTLV